MRMIRALLWAIIALLMPKMALAEVKPIEIEGLIRAIANVESNSNPSAVGDNGQAIGAFQLWPIFVDEVNRIAKTSFDYSDRWDYANSAEMVRLWIEHKQKKGWSIEKIVRCYNGGTNGHKKKATLKYWQKVKAEMERQVK